MGKPCATIAFGAPFTEFAFTPNGTPYATGKSGDNRKLCVTTLTLMRIVTLALRTFLSHLPYMAAAVCDGGGS